MTRALALWVAWFPFGLLACSSPTDNTDPAPEPPADSTPLSVAVTFPGPDFTLEGTLTLPAGSGEQPVAGLVLIHGSGPNSRDLPATGQLNMDFGFTIAVFAELAAELADRGYAVLRYDKRTCGTFNGRCNNAYPVPDEFLTVGDFQADAAAALAFLRSRPEVDGSRVVPVGLSQGAEFIAPLVAADPYTIGDYLSDYLNTKPVSTDDEVFQQAIAQVHEREQRFLDINGTRSVDYFHRRLGHLMIDYCGLARSKEGLEKAIAEIQALKDEFWRDLKVLGSEDSLNQSLERAGRVADFIELAELMCRDALDREESCGGHFRVEHQTEDGEARRDDEDYAFVSAWEWTDSNTAQQRHAEPLTFDYVPPSQRSYK